MDPLAQALELLDNAAAIISELVAQQQSKASDKDVEKKAELIAVKTGLTFEQASDMIKVAEAEGTDIDVMIKAASFLSKNATFGKVASNNYVEPRTGSNAIDSYMEKEAALLEELNLQ